MLFLTRDESDLSLHYIKNLEDIQDHIQAYVISCKIFFQ